MRWDFSWLKSGWWRLLSACRSLRKLKTRTPVDASKLRYEETLHYWVQSQVFTRNPWVRPGPGLVWESARSGQGRGGQTCGHWPGPERRGEIGDWAGISGERGLITGQQSEIRPRSEQISAELPALIKHQAFPQSRLNFCDQDRLSTIYQWPGCDQCCHLLSIIL